MLDDPRSGRLVAWGNAFLSGRTSLDEAAAAVVGEDEPHRAVGVPGENAPVALTVALGRLRAHGVRALRLALPAPGDPLGLPGPPAFNEAATASGEAVLTVGGAPLGVVPLTIRHGPEGDQAVSVRWQLSPVAPRPGAAPTLAEAERELADSMREAATTLAALDVARWRPEVGEALQVIRESGHDVPLAPGYPARAARVLALARRLGAVVVLAGDDPGAAVSASEQARRHAALQPLERSARRARVAAYNAVLEPGVTTH